MNDTTAVRNKRRLTSLYEWIGAFSGALAVVAVIFTCLFRIVNVDGTSMMNTLAHGEYLVLSRLPYTPDHGDIVVLYLDEREQSPLIKRVMGLAGDTISVDPDTGEVFRNGVRLQESYVHAPTAMEQLKGPVTVPEGYVFVMGDNRAAGHSLDSRTFGCVPVGNIMGKAAFRLFPLDRFGGIYDES